MQIEVLTWTEIQTLPEFNDGGIYSEGSYWGLLKEEEFARDFPDRIVELLRDTSDSDGDYKCAAFYYPACVIKRFISDSQEYGTHRILKRSPHGIPV